MDHYKLLRLIGKGAFGKVTLGIHKLTGKYVAIKSIERNYMKDEFSRKKVVQEVYILKKIRHANVIRLLEVFETQQQFFMVMEYASGGDLLRYIKKRRKLSEDEARRFFRQIVFGLGHIHSRGVLHRDIKLDNILLDEDGSVKICDFGISKVIVKSDIIKEQCGTPAYIAPEIITNEGYQGFYADHWSLGVLLYAMLCGTIPYKAESISELLKIIRLSPLTFSASISDNAKNLIKGLLTINPYERLSIPEILSHPWLIDEDLKSMGENEPMLGYKECLNIQANPLMANMNIVNLGNLFFSEEGKEELSYSDYCYICNDLYTKHIGNVIFDSR